MKFSKAPLQPFVALGILLLLSLGFGGYKLYEQKVALTTNIHEANMQLESLNESLSLKEKENTDLKTALEVEQKKNGTFEAQIGEIAGTVGTLEKLRKTDKELLQKYSKVYFLNENYIPAELSVIPKDFLSDSNRELEFHTRGLPFLSSLFAEARNAGLTLRIASAYRSFNSQTALKSNYKTTYGTGANKFSADQGYSEHQLGTALDFITPALGGSLTGFEKTKENEWLLGNAYRYGFILSYPKGNAFYQYEPWHWRFVGVKLATKLHEEKQNFYDLEQREIDNYLISIFD